VCKARAFAILQCQALIRMPLQEFPVGGNEEAEEETEDLVSDHLDMPEVCVQKYCWKQKGSI